MDEQLKKWQNQWTQESTPNLNIEQLSYQLKQRERSHRFQRILIPLLLSFSLFTMVYRLSTSIYNTIALLIIGIAMLFLIIPLYQSRFHSIYKQLNTDNKSYLQAYIKKIETQLLIPQKYMLIFILLFTFALNIAFWGAFDNHPLVVRLGMHLSSLILAFLLFLLRKRSIIQYKHKLTPLLHRLKSYISEH